MEGVVMSRGGRISDGVAPVPGSVGSARERSVRELLAALSISYPEMKVSQPPPGDQEFWEELRQLRQK